MRLSSDGFRQNYLIITNIKKQKRLQKFCKFISIFPATRSRTATLLRLHPNHQFYNEFKQLSSKIDSSHVTGGVYKTN